MRSSDKLIARGGKQCWRSGTCRIPKRSVGCSLSSGIAVCSSKDSFRESQSEAMHAFSNGVSICLCTFRIEPGFVSDAPTGQKPDRSHTEGVAFNQLQSNEAACWPVASHRTAS